MEKRCSQCKIVKPLSEFAVQSIGRFGRRADCKLCVKRFTRSVCGLVKSIYGQQVSKSKKRQYAKPSYTEKELYSWVISQPQFQQLYDVWVLSNYTTGLRPSVDRLNDYKSYTLDNIQLLTMQGNIDKYYKDQLFGKNVKNCRAVDMLDLEGNFIQRFHSAAEAARHVNGINSNIIGACINRVTRKKEADGSYRRITQYKSYGYKWRYSTISNVKGEML